MNYQHFNIFNTCRNFKNFEFYNRSEHLNTFDPKYVTIKILIL